ncbi:hypothetical protein HZC21_05475 [Candidatus Peregrinibacteria bacterium]|nr:hypothetical protein [Candidatus Peregrinibacteria bacterium]
MATEGYPVKNYSGLLNVKIHGEKKEIQEGGNLIDNWPPKPGDQLFRVQDGVKQAVGFVLKEQMEPKFGTGIQYWEVEQVG